MVTRTVVATPARGVLDLSSGGRRAARAAAWLTVGEVVTLGVFFAVGEPWGTINDGLVIALAGATVPIAIGFARRTLRSVLLVLGGVVDVVGVAVTTTFTTLLIARRMTFEESLPGVLAGQALIGCWLVAAALAARSDPGSRRLSAFGISGGTGLVATAVGIATGGMESPLAVAGYVAGLIGSIDFYMLPGRQLGGWGEAPGVSDAWSREQRIESEQPRHPESVTFAPASGTPHAAARSISHPSHMASASRS